MPISIGILTGITGGGVLAQLPAQQDIVSKYQRSFSADDTEWIDINASGDYAVEKGHSITFNGSVSGEMDDPVVVVGNFTISVGMYAPNLTLTKRVLGSASAVEGILSISLTLGEVIVHIAGTAYTLAASTPVINSFVVRRVGSTLYLDYEGETVSVAASAADITFRYIGKHATLFFKGWLYDIHIKDETGVVFSNFIAQGSDDYLMLSEHGPDVQFTLCAVYKTIEYGHEWENYTVVADGSKIPQNPDNIGYDVTGGALTNPGTPLKNMVLVGYSGDLNTATIYAPECVSFYNSCVAAGIEGTVYTGGSANGLTLAEWKSIATNPVFWSDSREMLVAYNDTQSGDTLDQINDYLS